MSLAQSAPPKGKRRRRWLQFSLRTMLLATLVVALLLGWLAKRIDTAWKQQRAAESILKLGGQVDYAYQRTRPTPALGLPLPPPEPPGPTWLRRLLGEHFFARVVVVTYPPGITDNDLKHLDDLPYLTEIYLRGGTVTGAGLHHLWKHDKLRSLSLRSVPLTDADVANLAAFTQLKSLDLCHTPITDGAVETLSRLPNLSGLRLAGTHVTREAETRLEKPLSLYYGGEETWAPAPSEEQRQIAAALERDGALVDVRRKIYDSEPEYSVTFHQTSMDERKLGLLERLGSLKTLLFFQMSVDEGHWARMAGCDIGAADEAEATDGQPTGGKGLRQLKTLAVLNVPVTDKDMPYIKKLANLEVLYLDDTQITDAGLAHLPSLENLRELGLDGPGFTDAGLVRLGDLPNLKELSLSGAQFTDDGLKHVGALSQLEELSLWDGATITDDGLAHLAGLENLTWLSVDSPNITDAGLMHVAKLTNLTQLSLRGPKNPGETGVLDTGDGAQVSQAGLEHVRKLPRLKACWVNGTNVIDWTGELPMVPVLE